jgi:hypothetical protein
MTAEEKINKMREIEQVFSQKIDQIKLEYQQEMRKIIAAMEQEKISKLKQELGI